MTTIVVPQSTDITARVAAAQVPPSPHITINTAVGQSPRAVPNKHIPYCSPGPQPLVDLHSPPTTPPKAADAEYSSILYPPDPRALVNHRPHVYALTASTLAAALDHLATRPLPDPSTVFPWLHGLHPENQIQLSFFTARRKSLRKTPTCLRGLTIVKAGGDLSGSKLKGAVAPTELLCDTGSKCDDTCFLDVDPQIGFSVRNFHIQTCKLATVSDIVVYGDDETAREEVEELAMRISRAQEAWKQHSNDPYYRDTRRFNTFIMTDSFATLELHHPQLIALDANGRFTGKVLDLSMQEHDEMYDLSKPSEICNNVWLGSTLPSLDSDLKQSNFDVLIEARDYADMPNRSELIALERFLDNRKRPSTSARLSIASSGSIAPRSGTQADEERFLSLCHWIYSLANPPRTGKTPRKILIHCADGYTETTLFALAYFMFAEGVPLHQAWVRMHTEKSREFFAYAADKLFLQSLETRLLKESPVANSVSNYEVPEWMEKMDGSLPSRILPYLYLGNLNHAQNPTLLKQLGINRVLSVGEPIKWDDNSFWDCADFLFIDNVQDNGVDPLTKEINKCLDFIQSGRDDGGATLVHCRVGVSRSATICIAEVMKELDLPFARAYCFVRARRLNVIIQPHLLFAYELLKWEEQQRENRGLPVRREIEWWTLAQQIALLNKPYCKQ